MVEYTCKDCGIIMDKETNKWSGVFGENVEWCDSCITDYWGHTILKGDEARLNYLIDTAAHTSYEDFSTTCSDNFKDEQQTKAFWRKVNTIMYDEIDRECPYDEPLHYHHDGCPSCYTKLAWYEADEGKHVSR